MTIWAWVALGVALTLAGFFWLFDRRGERLAWTLGSLGLAVFPLLLLIMTARRRRPTPL